MTFKFLDKLSQDFSELLNDKEEYNVVIEVGRERYKKSFTAHSAVLRYRSSYFCKELTNTVPDDDNNKIIIKPNISAQIFEILLKYIYGGIIDTEKIDIQTTFELMILVNELEFEELSEKLENYFIESKTSWLKAHFTFLSQDFSELLNDKEEYNVVIEVGRERYKKSFTAHSAVLRYRSSYFCKELTNTVPDDDNNKIIIKPNISAQIFEILLKYIYGGIIDTEKIDIQTTFELMILVNELEFEELSEKLENYFIESKTSWLKAHFTFVYHLIFKNNEFQNLEKFCNDIIAKHPSIIFESAEFISLHESALASILKRDDLQMKESEIWDYVIKWGTAQNSTLPEKLKEWSDENFITLKTTLQQCIPLVRYFHISNSDVMDKIKPYKKILGKKLWNDLKLHLILPDRPIKSIILPPRLVLKQELPARVVKSFSTIINEEHASMISSWIDYQQTSYSSRNNPYEFQLILRGSKDGFAPITFWDICDGHANTIVVTKVKGTDEIIGGFNPLAWDKTKGEWMKTDESFIFSFKDGNIQNSILSRVKNENQALWYSTVKGWYGPIFGCNEFMMRSVLSNFTQDELNMCQCSTENKYEKSIRTTNDGFSIIDYEVFKVVKKLI
ncbi:hypothetical protein Glove_230g76 [Diversispora epigaea]|uniref:BTB domain-containing protein n=1 Tax=Diversispora epigaea TaxID=1348612 RepID=A0A397ILK5_9GLOM|nr:hypothetical protein Glove_230g76 [Diversispora epigaea]